jgi:hypothetical protein
MKKFYLLFTATLLLSSSYGQGLYLKFGGGYAVPMGSQSLMEPQNITQVVGNTTIVTTTTSVVKGSYGAGVVINGAVGYKFSPFIGIDLNLFYQLGKEYEGTSTTEAGGTTGTAVQTKKSEGFFLAPTMMFMAGTEKVRPYAVVGIITGMVNLIDESNIHVDNIRDLPLDYTLVQETKGDLAFGFRGGIGVDINLSSRLSLYAEGIFNAISYYPKESEYTEATIDGDDFLSDFTVRQKKSVYVDEVTIVTEDGESTADPTKPTERLRSPLPLSSLSLTVGLKIKLGSD